MCDEILYLSLRAFPSQCIYGEPLINQGRIISGEEVRQVRGELETRGDVIIWGLWIVVILEIEYHYNDTM